RPAEDAARLVDLADGEGDAAALGLAEGRFRAGERAHLAEEDLGRVGVPAAARGTASRSRRRLLLAGAEGERDRQEEQAGAPRCEGPMLSDARRGVGITAFGHPSPRCAKSVAFADRRGGGSGRSAYRLRRLAPAGSAPGSTERPN